MRVAFVSEATSTKPLSPSLALTIPLPRLVSYLDGWGAFPPFPHSLLPFSPLVSIPRCLSFHRWIWKAGWLAGCRLFPKLCYKTDTLTLYIEIQSLFRGMIWRNQNLFDFTHERLQSFKTRLSSFSLPSLIHLMRQTRSNIHWFHFLLSLSSPLFDVEDIFRKRTPGGQADGTNINIYLSVYRLKCEEKSWSRHNIA